MTPDQMLAFESKNLWDCYFPLQPVKRIINAPGDEVLGDGSGFSEGELWAATTIVDIGSDSTTASASVHISTLKTSLSQLEQTRSSVTHTWFPPQHTQAHTPPPEIQPDPQCHSYKWRVTGETYQCQRQAALRDFDSALFPQLNRRLCFAKQTNKQGT